jgi:hypothetical protein
MSRPTCQLLVGQPRQVQASQTYHIGDYYLVKYESAELVVAPVDYRSAEVV